MKKIMFSMAVAILTSVSLANATPTFASITPASVTVDQEKVEVKPEELPDAVKATLAAEPYNAWQIQKAFLLPGENDTPVYEIALIKGEETSAVKLNKDGKVVE
jgi:hypothetical protein